MENGNDEALNIFLTNLVKNLMEIVISLDLAKIETKHISENLEIDFR